MAVNGPGTGHVNLTPADNTVVAKNAAGSFPRALRFGTGGSITWVAPDGTIATYTNIANGETIEVGCKILNESGRVGCADIVGIY